ncbi:hypothetical protein ACFFMN_05700 [Planobispora siamensis]|uniref:HEAT repeat-containing protein n=1 Tax=Planobispora siamensis TaxID=936338 RepID=A0A8J3WLX1_9ACTN|nr:hypothetical protein [Planobispora siamensis]GIH94323.1 hypothetical protein Psi01_49530 [Planobispora siamensis]
MPLIARSIGEDPDAAVRRLAILSLLWWKKAAHPYADAVRAAAGDPAEEVREAAAYWLREQSGTTASPPDPGHRGPENRDGGDMR